MTIRQLVTCSVLVGGLALLAACSGKDKPGNFVAPDTGGAAGASTASGGTSGDSESAGKGGSSGGTVSVLTPLIEITEPAPASDPNSDPVLIEDQVTVLCTVTASTASGAKPVDPSTVKIEMLDADSKSVKTFVGIATDHPDEYSAGFVVASLPSGSVSFRCSASDTASTPHAATAQVDTLIDRGPEISIQEPADKSAHNLLGAMNVQFGTAPARVTPKDKQAGVTSVTLTVGGTPITTVSNGDGTYQASVNFNDKKLFGSPPSGAVPIVITATNGRNKPGPAKSTFSYGIVVDGEGPVITLTAPDARAVIGPASVLTFTVADGGAGVDRTSVEVTLDTAVKSFSTDDGLWSWTTGDSYSFKIGSALSSKTAITQVTVNVRAKDKAGNASDGNSRIFHLDNVAPVVDLDPPKLYEVRTASSGKQQCSEPFDPLGDASKGGSPDDTQTIDKYGTFRALVWDRTNDDGQSTFYYAGTNPDSVRLYVQSDTTAPLLADKDGDGVCEEIYTGSIPFQYKPTDKPLPFLALKGITPMGNPEWSGTTVPAATNCNPGEATPAAKLCTSNSVDHSPDLNVIIRHSMGDKPPWEKVIYAIDPVGDPTASLCTGDEWRIASAISATPGTPKLGWVCIAARAEDAVGNVGISPPLRVCVADSDIDPNPCKTPPPSCTDHCTAPAHFAGRVVRHD